MTQQNVPWLIKKFLSHSKVMAEKPSNYTIKVSQRIHFGLTWILISNCSRKTDTNPVQFRAFQYKRLTLILESVLLIMLISVAFVLPNAENWCVQLLRGDVSLKTISFTVTWKLTSVLLSSAATVLRVMNRTHFSWNWPGWLATPKIQTLFTWHFSTFNQYVLLRATAHCGWQTLGTHAVCDEIMLFPQAYSKKPISFSFFFSTMCTHEFAA